MQSSTFTTTLTPPTLDSHFREHVAHAFDTVYRNPYPDSETKTEHHIARQIHGITHVTRAANYIYPLVNLYQHFGDKEAAALTKEDIHLIKIAVLYHDSARQGEGTDLWDRESAEMLFNYLTKTLGVSEKKAVLLAEAAANKDADETKYYELSLKNGTVQWTLSKEKRKKSIYQKLIHDADCLDIIRARPSFDASYLDFYKQIASHNKIAFELMATLITEARDLIHQHGDRHGNLDFKRKPQFEHRDADRAIDKCIQQMPTSLLSTLHERLLTPTEFKPFLSTWMPDEKAAATKGTLTEAIMQAKLRQGKVFARGIPLSSAIRKKESSTKDAKETKKQPEETLAQIEIRKMMRRLGIPTRTQKPNRLLKDGNPNRSISMIGWGAETYSDAGFLIVDPDLNAISSISKTDSDSGRLKKNNFDYKINRDTPTETQAKLDALLHQQKMGGASVTFFQETAAHNEVTYTIKQVDAVYFSHDDNLFNRFSFTGEQSTHNYSPILQAIYLQNEYYRMTKQSLPLFEYSGTHNFIKERHYSNDEIVHMWETMCRDYIEQRLASGQYDVMSMSIEEIKTVSMYQGATMDYVKQNAPADANYTDTMKHIINTRLISMHQEMVAKHQTDLLKKLIETSSILDSDTLYRGILQYPTLAEHPVVKAKLLAEIDRKLSDERYLKIALEEESSILLTGLGLTTKDYALLISDKNAFLSIKHIASSYHDTMINKLYSLAKKIKLDEHVQTIQKLAHQAILHQIQQSNSSLFESYYLDKILEISCLFDCYEDHKDLIMQTIETHLATPLRSHYQLRNIAIAADHLVQYHLINEGIIQQLRIAADHYAKQLIENPECSLDLGWYLNLARHTHIPITQQVKVAEAYIQHNKPLNYGSNHYDIVELAESGLLNDEHLFQLIIDTIYHCEKPYSCQNTLTSYNDYAHEFTLLFKDQTLSDAQLAYIEKTKQSVANQYYISVVSDLMNSKLSSSEISVMIKLGNAANIPLTRIKSNIIAILSDSESGLPISDYDRHFLNLLKESSWLRDDAELFEQWIIHFTSNKIDDFAQEIDLLKRTMPINTFSKMQSETIYRHAVERFGEAIARQRFMSVDLTSSTQGLFAIKPAIKTEETTTPEKTCTLSQSNTR